MSLCWAKLGMMSSTVLVVHWHRGCKGQSGLCELVVLTLLVAI